MLNGLTLHDLAVTPKAHSTLSKVLSGLVRPGPKTLPEVSGSGGGGVIRRYTSSHVVTYRLLLSLRHHAICYVLRI